MQMVMDRSLQKDDLFGSFDPYLYDFIIVDEENRKFLLKIFEYTTPVRWRLYDDTAFTLRAA